MATRLIILLALALGGCASTMSASSFCRLGGTVTTSKEDKLSPKTARQILKRNERYRDLCVVD